jgi:hypothetical protein
LHRKSSRSIYTWGVMADWTTSHNRKNQSTNLYFLSLALVFCSSFVGVLHVGELRSVKS